MRTADQVVLLYFHGGFLLGEYGFPQKPPRPAGETVLQVDLSAAGTSKWLGLGQHYHGFQVVFDAFTLAFKLALARRQLAIQYSRTEAIWSHSDHLAHPAQMMLQDGRFNVDTTGGLEQGVIFLPM